MLAKAHPSLLSELRAATSAKHAHLDAQLGLLEREVTRERYEAFLRGSLLALEPLEAALGAFYVAESARSSLIRADLAELGSSLSNLREGRFQIENLAQAYGARYVVEGSALGGAVLARTFQKALGPSAGSMRYLTMHGDRLAEHWRAFMIELEGWGKVITPEMRSEACGTARAVFDLYEAAFEAAGAFSESP